MSDTIKCPACQGHVGKRWRGDDLDEALAAHKKLAHAPVTTTSKESE